MKEPSRRRTIYISDALWEWLDKRAEQDSRSASGLLRWLIKQLRRKEKGH